MDAAGKRAGKYMQEKGAGNYVAGKKAGNIYGREIQGRKGRAGIF
jgi:hypothetical protein